MADGKQVGALSIKQVAQSAGIGRSTVYAQLAAGKLSAVKVGRRTLVLVSEFSRWLSSLPRV
ncbi:helix-turn-helix domain-containing protein [Alsobacter sp. R-9]